MLRMYGTTRLVCRATRSVCDAAALLYVDPDRGIVDTPLSMRVRTGLPGDDLSNPKLRAALIHRSDRTDVRAKLFWPVSNIRSLHAGKGISHPPEYKESRMIGPRGWQRKER